MVNKAPAFTPGRFKPVVEVSQRDTGVPAPADTDFTGLAEATTTSLEVSQASARGFGAIYPSTVPNANIGKVIGYVLACKNLAEQLGFLSIYARVSGPLRQAPTTLEPIVRFYNYYGHFEHQGKVYVARGARDALVYNLFRLRQWAHEKMLSRERNLVRVNEDEFAKIDFTFYSLGDDGNVVFGKKKGLKEYLVELAKSLLDYEDCSFDERIPLARQVFDISTEEGLSGFLRRLRVEVADFTPPDRNVEGTPTEEHKTTMRKLFGLHYSSDGDTIPVAKFTEVITGAYRLLAELSQERGAFMKTITFPKYEGGSPSQLAELVDDVLFSEVPLALDESTVAMALTTSYGTRAQYRSAPNVDRAETRRSLVAQSIIQK